MLPGPVVPLCSPCWALGAQCPAQAGHPKCLHCFQVSASGWFFSLLAFLLLTIELWKHSTSGISEDFALQSNCISEEERDAYEELLTQAEIQGTIDKVNSK